MPKKIVLITGCSSGLGIEIAWEAARKGHQVVATMRNLERKQALEERFEGSSYSFDLIQCDVNDDESMSSCVAETVKRHGRVDVLVNNAGYGLFGPAELPPMQNIRQQMETNYFGLVAMTQKVLPLMRKQRQGYIINISSIAGTVAMPMMGYYNASKYAVEGFTEALFHEVKPFGIHAVLVEPGRFETDFGTRSLVPTTVPANHDYSRMEKNMNLMMNNKNAFNKGANAKHVGRLVVRIFSKSSPRLRYPIGLDALGLKLAKCFLPNWIRNQAIRTVFHRF